jgi:hypothetical protein
MAEPVISVTGVTTGALDFRVSPRTSAQQAAFFEARHFTPEGIARIRATCFLTFGIVNRTPQVVWLELDHWRFMQDGQPVHRISRPEWRTLWQEIDLPPANRATFDWTQLPEVRDLRPDEPVSGNVALTPPQGEFGLEATFRTGADGGGAPITVRVTGLRCGGDTAP